MKPVEANAALGTVAAQASPPHICSTSPIGNPQFVSEAKPALAAVSAAPVLITEQQVLFSTAAAVSYSCMATEVASAGRATSVQTD